MAPYDRRRRNGFHGFMGWGVIGALSLCLGLGTRLPLEEPRRCGQWCTFNDRRLFLIDYLSFRSRLLTDIISGTRIRSSDVLPSPYKEHVSRQSCVSRVLSIVKLSIEERNQNSSAIIEVTVCASSCIILTFVLTLAQHAFGPFVP